MREAERSIHRFRSLSQASAFAGMLVALLALVGWLTGRSELRTVHPSLVSMSMITSICLLLGGAGVWLLREERSTQFKRLGILLGGAVFVFATVKLFDGRVGPEILGDFLGPWGPGGVYPSAMSDYTSAGLILLGASLMVMNRETERGYAPAQFLALTSLGVVLFVLIGYAYDVHAIAHGTPDFPMALNTALGLGLLNVGVLCARPEKGPMAIFTVETAGGHLMRRLLPTFLVLPFLLGWLRLQGERIGLFEAWFGVAAMTALMVVTVIGLTWWNAYALHGLEGERERALIENRRREAEYRALAEHSPDLIGRFDGALRCLYANPALKAVLVAQGPPDGSCALEAWVPDLRRVLASGEATSTEFDLPAGADGVQTFQARLVPEFDLDGSIHSVLVVSRDITAMREAYQALEAADRHKDDFLAVVSHELRTPLSGILGFVSFLQDGVGGRLNPEQQAFADRAMAGVERLKRLIDDLVDYARVLSGKLALDPVPTPFDALVEEAVASIEEAAAAKRLTVTARVSLSALPCLDGFRIAQVLIKLLDNAVKFTPEGGRVAVTATMRDGCLITEVTDTGPGVSAEQAARIFAPFHQADMSVTRASGGLGLGLAIGKAIVEAHGGEVGYRPAPGGGSTFWFTLPAVVEGA